jgi:hypothetical protein
MITGVYVREISKLGWLIGVLKHVIWADSLYILCPLLFQSPKQIPFPKRRVLLFLIPDDEQSAEPQ